jgi:hypothetical protein
MSSLISTSGNTGVKFTLNRFSSQPSQIQQQLSGLKFTLASFICSTEAVRVKTGLLLFEVLVYIPSTLEPGRGNAGGSF